MSADIDADEAANLFAQLRARGRDSDRSIAGRRVAEARPMSRRRVSKNDRTEQVNLRFAPAFKKFLQAIAAQKGMPMTDVIETAVKAHYAGGAE